MDTTTGVQFSTEGSRWKMTTRPPLSPVARRSPSWLNSTQDMISAGKEQDTKSLSNAVTNTKSLSLWAFCRLHVLPSVTSSSSVPLTCEKYHWMSLVAVPGRKKKEGSEQVQEQPCFFENWAVHQGWHSKHNQAAAFCHKLLLMSQRVRERFLKVRLGTDNNSTVLIFEQRCPNFLVAILINYSIALENKFDKSCLASKPTEFRTKAFTSLGIWLSKQEKTYLLSGTQSLKQHSSFETSKVSILFPSLGHGLKIF